MTIADQLADLSRRIDNANRHRLGTVEHLTGNNGTALALLDAKIAKVHERLMCEVAV